MANYRKGSVIFVDTSAAFAEVLEIKSIKYIGNTSGTASLKSEASSGGSVVWEESGTANVFNGDVGLKDRAGFYVTVTNSAKVYLYLK